MNSKNKYKIIYLISIKKQVAELLLKILQRRLSEELVRKVQAEWEEKGSWVKRQGERRSEEKPQSGKNLVSGSQSNGNT